MAVIAALAPLGPGVRSAVSWVVGVLGVLGTAIAIHRTVRYRADPAQRREYGWAAVSVGLNTAIALSLIQLNLPLALGLSALEAMLWLVEARGRKQRAARG